MYRIFTASPPPRSPSSRRAWIEIPMPSGRRGACASPSSRRAWIEIFYFPFVPFTAFVALLAEGVDRNFDQVAQAVGAEGSPSSRRAWIEIRRSAAGGRGIRVALLAEGVDRNSSAADTKPLSSVALLAEGVDRNRFGGGTRAETSSRPPRGGRG